MKQVSYKVAKAIERAGWQWNEYDEGVMCTRPTYLDVWIWLWEKEICIEIKNNHYYTLAKVNNERFHADTPEEAIIAAIEYLVDNKLLK